MCEVAAQFEHLPTSRGSAVTLGSTHYFTGKPCRNGHLSPKFTTNSLCVECSNTNRKKSEQKDPERTRERARKRTAAWRASHPEEAAESGRASQRKLREDPEFRERGIAYHKARRQDPQFREQYLERDRKRWAALSPEEKDAKRQYQNQWFAKWYKKNSDKALTKYSKRRAAKLNATPTWADQEQIRQIYAAAARLTQETGIPHEVDHRIPLKGENVCGLHVHTNLQILVREENRRKQNHFDSSAPHASGGSPCLSL